MKILVTGSQGFIGSHLMEAYGSKENIQVFGWGRDGIYEPQGDIISRAGLMNPDDAISVLSKLQPDIIFHCAGNADVNSSIQQPFTDLQNNYITTHNVLFAMKKLDFNKCRFILMSSAAVYGNPESLPIDEKQVPNPLSPYALHKRAAEEACLFMYKNYGLDVKILRIFSAYGPGLRKQIFWDMYQKIISTGELNLWGCGEESRDYIYIDDLVEAAILVAEQAPKDDTIYNIANGEEVRINTVAQTFCQLMKIDDGKIHFKGVRREGDPINWKADIDKLKRLGYVRKVSFEDGVKNYFIWLKNLEDKTAK